MDSPILLTRLPFSVALPFMTLIFGKLVTVFNGSDGQNAPFNQGIFRQAVAKNA